ncbi:MAG: DNA-binding protein [Prevotella sp.]|nr:DNA-binding protein [Prevotella sp.]
MPNDRTGRKNQINYFINPLNLCIMSVKYRKVKNNRKGSATRGKIYGKAVVDGVIRTKEIAEKIGKRCTLTEPDIIAVINALETEIAYALADGKRVILDGFGSFKVGISTSPADTPKKFTTANIKGFHVVFAPAIEMYMNKRIKSMLRGVKVEEMTEYNGLDSGSDGTSGGGSDGGGNSGGSSTGDNKNTGNSGDNKDTGSSGDNKDTGSSGDNEHIVL